MARKVAEMQFKKRLEKQQQKELFRRAKQMRSKLCFFKIQTDLQESYVAIIKNCSILSAPSNRNNSSVSSIFLIIPPLVFLLLLSKGKEKLRLFVCYHNNLKYWDR